MQLTPDPRISDLRQAEAAKRRRHLVAATLSLLGISGGPASAEPLKWTIDSGLLYYKEGAGRVQAIEPVVNGSVDLGGDRTLSAGVVLDTLSGATPNGATPWSQPQTFTSPSGKGKSYTVAPGATPLDPTFKDTRIALLATTLLFSAATAFAGDDHDHGEGWAPADGWQRAEDGVLPRAAGSPCWLRIDASRLAPRVLEIGGAAGRKDVAVFDAAGQQDPVDAVQQARQAIAAA